MNNNRNIQDIQYATLPGGVMALLHFLVTVVLIWAGYIFSTSHGVNSITGEITTDFSAGIASLFGLALLVFNIFCFNGYFILSPNTAAILQLFGKYKGTVQSAGMHWVNPFLNANKVTQRAMNWESSHIKVNDSTGSPIEIGAVIVWHVSNPASALLSVANFQKFLEVQSDSALRQLASSHPYDNNNDANLPSLQGHVEEMSEELKKIIQDHVTLAGVTIEQARISHLAYAPEIAQAMLQRQQASAIVAARKLIVEGAVGMVHEALNKLREDGVVELDEERKAQMVSNLLVVLCSDRATQPVINAGTIHS